MMPPAPPSISLALDSSKISNGIGSRSSAYLESIVWGSLFAIVWGSFYAIFRFLKILLRHLQFGVPPKWGN
jgi:hypothetical protein